ncbi:hypothetical protein O181_105033 [Austropuccinia psidii MF-1]|uniref:Uncharacterized protein n=1 Tax=Austropuccinia psidii MF-1 TaxID=1389203 RepID=A0A9Q3JNA6_9BASI|nr:hypothetical protein [Austropuccinia psidii MF-1]
MEHIRPPVASTACGPWNTLGPFWPNSNEAKRGQGGRPTAPNSRWASLSLFWSYIQEVPKWPKDLTNPDLAQGPKTPRMAISLKTQTMASGNHQRQPGTFNKRFPLKIRETSGPTQWTQVCRNQEWCMYGIIYHYAPFFLSNSVVTFSGLHYAISNQFPRQITHFKGRLQTLSLTIHGSYQKTI